MATEPRHVVDPFKMGRPHRQPYGSENHSTKPFAKRVWNKFTLPDGKTPDLDHLYATALTAHRELRHEGETLAAQRVRQREEA